MAATSIFRHIRNYASAGMLSALAGLISFPILTRNLSVEEYGILGLITASLTLFIAIGKLGVQHAVIRFFAQIKHGNLSYSLSQMNSTVALVFFILASSTTVFWLIAGYGVLPRFLQYADIATLFLIASGVVFVRLSGSGILNFLRAQQRSGEVAKTQILARYLNLTMVVFLLLFSSLNPYYLLACLLVAEIVAVGYATTRYWPDFSFKMNHVSAPLARALLIYGMPLMILESLGLVLRLSDRYLIEAMLGVNELGMYSASYSLTAYFEPIVMASLMQAVKPLYMHLWESDGPALTKSFLAKGLHVYLVLGLPVVALFSLASPHLMNLLASPKFSPGTIIIPFVAISFLLDGAMLFLGAGLYIFKNTKALMLWGAIATVVNLALNFMVIPVYGILGASIVTVISFMVFMLGVSIQAFRYVAFPVRLAVPLLVAMLSLGVYLTLQQLELGSDIVSMLVKGVIGSVVLLGGIWLLDPIVRDWIRNHWRLSAANQPK